MAEHLEAAVDIIASPERVWRVLTDLDRMPEFSPTTRRMKALGTMKAGTWTLNWNKVGRRVWPTSSRIVSYDPEREFAFRMNENGVTWRYTLAPIATGTRLTQERDVSAGVRWLPRKLIELLFGGEAAFERDLVEGMNTTLGRIKVLAETP